MTYKNKYETFFDEHASQYMENIFTKGTKMEVDFLLKKLDLPTGSKILDVGCGTGRHSVELAKKGYKMTGIDLSAGMLEKAREAASKEGVEVEFIKADATKFRADSRFDAIICLCEGAFTLSDLSEDPIEHDRMILKNIYNSLEPGGKFILTCTNAMKLIRKHSQEDVDRGIFDPLTLTEIVTMEYDAPEGKRKVKVRERGYTAPELQLLFSLVGFEIKAIYGGTAGNWGERPIELDEYEIMVIAEKP
ncbi:MAG: class I SAM-dependent methyltransferase [Candidatus Eremiobacteraeota bacterium]|nr:class I SAM-dependent methyltransferase [Candidatus Eremiobacteraeota bacterium]